MNSGAGANFEAQVRGLTIKDKISFEGALVNKGLKPEDIHFVLRRPFIRPAVASEAFALTYSVPMVKKLSMPEMIAKAAKLSFRDSEEI